VNVRITIVTNTDKEMTEPHVELKSVHFGYSREWGSNGRFDADVWINGVKCMKAIDEGNGGEIDYEHFIYKNPQAKQVKANIKLLEAYIKTMPKQSLGGIHEGGKLVMFTIDMDLYINNLLDKMSTEKFQKKLLKHFEKAICFGVPNGKQYRSVYWTGKTLAQIDKINLQRTYDKTKAGLGKGETILNTNLQALGINL
jgi:hypothetical protein